jgi:hypothetical protein
VAKRELTNRLNIVKEQGEPPNRIASPINVADSPLQNHTVGDVTFLPEPEDTLSRLPRRNK